MADLTLANQNMSQVADRGPSMGASNASSDAISEQEDMHRRVITKTKEIEEANKKGSKEERRKMAKKLKAAEEMEKE